MRRKDEQDFNDELQNKPDKSYISENPNSVSHSKSPYPVEMHDARPAR
jgi:hypothetical protein